MTEGEKILAEEGEHALWETITIQRQKIESLEKEKEDLKRGIKVRDCGISELESKNTELKKQLNWKEKALSKAKKETQKIANRVNKDKRRLIRRKHENADQLTKAKKIIGEFVSNYKNKTIYVENIKQLLEQAEQLLKDIKE